jgi:hypothetical protein
MYTLDRGTHQDLTELIEDSVEFFCDEYRISGELTWVVIESLAKAKQAQLRGECK